MFKVFIVGVSFTVIVAPCSAIQFVARALIGTPRLAGLMMRAVLLTVALAEPFLSEESHQQAFEKFVKDFEKAYSATALGWIFEVGLLCRGQATGILALQRMLVIHIDFVRPESFLLFCNTLH